MKLRVILERNQRGDVLSGLCMTEVEWEGAPDAWADALQATREETGTPTPNDFLTPVDYGVVAIEITEDVIEAAFDRTRAQREAGTR